MARLLNGWIAGMVRRLLGVCDTLKEANRKSFQYHICIIVDYVAYRDTAKLNDSNNEIAENAIDTLVARFGHDQRQEEEE